MRGQIGMWGIVVGVLSMGVLFRASMAWAADERPLLVAVEVAPGGGAEAAEVRKAIGIELHRTILALGDSSDTRAPAGGDSDVLLVDVGRERIVLALRRSSDEPVARSLPAPTDRAARLRAIVWMAGNLARDQVTPFLASTADRGAFVTAMAVEPATPPEVVAPAPSPPTEPPRLVDFGAAATVSVAAPPPPPLVERLWSVTAAGGPAYYLAEPRSNQTVSLRSTAWQLELLKHRPDGWLWGAAIDVGATGFNGLGAAVQGGVEQRWGKLVLQGTVGFGLESGPANSFSSTVSSDGSSQRTQVVSYTTVFYGRGFVTLSRALSPTWDLLFRVGLPSVFAGGPVVGRALGLRDNLP